MTKKKKKKLVIIILIVLALLLSLGGCFFLKKEVKHAEWKELSNTSVTATTPNLSKTSEDEYFELMGFGQLEINKDNPYLNLINPSNNDVYLSFDVIYKNEVLYSTKLIEPGQMEQFNVYSCLDAGEHTITYSINVYDTTDQSTLWTGIQQEQEIVIKK